MVLDRTHYISKMENCLSDVNTYTFFQRNPMNKLLINLKELLRGWLNSNYVSAQTHYYINSSNPIMPRAYGLPKIHEKELSLENYCFIFWEPFAQSCHILRKFYKIESTDFISHINNSLDLINKLNSLHIPENCTLVSLYVISLFTNVPIEMVMDILDEK